MCSCLWAGLVEAARNLMWEASALIRPPAHVVLVGLDSSGKTTALFRLRYGQYVNAVPTVGFNMERVRAGGAQWLIWDVGGAERVRPLWRSYTRATDALIFVVDSSTGEERLEETRVELQRLTKQQSAQCVALNRPRPPLLILANKQDLPGAREPHHLAKALGLPDLPDNQPWSVAPACAVTGEGLEEAMVTLHDLVTKSRQPKSKSTTKQPSQKS
ncbi:ADP-ribosylation factor-like protein 4C [Macrobrachium rosenbergii]|uniref:ADP-ribosylation factor-like protein 4C n=1 Tax=Macrobrachium rosenbergii TaxID=79674 RepID=UPI0034D46145